jgi:murein DD-endopeptidase MepM/ murein hydrolase activator NlpD
LRKLISFILILFGFSILACNFPITSLPGLFGQVPTLDQSIFDATPAVTGTPQLPEATPIPPIEYDPAKFSAYTVQSGDTLTAVAAHFGVNTDQIASAQPITGQGILPPGQVLILPRLVEDTPYPQFVLPDSEIVNAESGRAFNIQEYITGKNGKLADYSQTVNDSTLSGAEIVKLVSENTSVNPRFLLAFIEFRSKWVTENPADNDLTYPLGLNIPNYEGLFLELSASAKILNAGYYAWRSGSITELSFADGTNARIAPDLNAGSAAVQYLFAKLFKQSTWYDALYGTDGFLATYERLFGDPMVYARSVEPLFTADVQAPTLELPFAPGEEWVLTGGLHNDWNTGTPLGALDFAPNLQEVRCSISSTWVRASADGIVTRSGDGLLQTALVDSEKKTTGWELLYLHVSAKDRPMVGTLVHTNDLIGHPSCEGGEATGRHVHLTRLYRGEWIGAGDPFPLILSGWLAVPGDKPFYSTLVKGDQVVTGPNLNGNHAIITR